MDSFLSLFDPELSTEAPAPIKSSPSHWERNGNIGSNGEIGNENLPPEPQYGNVEYKLKLINPSRQRFEHLVTQMKWRLREGQGEAIYEIGVEDSGILRGLCQEEMAASLNTLNEMAVKLGANTIVLRETPVSNLNGITNTVAEVLVRKAPDESFSVDLRVAVMGHADAGKSTLLGVLTNGVLDNGKGRARLNMFRHLHEIQSGRTSSISHEVIGFDKNGNAINYQEGTPATICELSSKIVTLIDLCGHKKYLKTTISGITGYRPHYLLFVISSSSGLTKMTKEHLSLALALQIPVVIVLTKVDLSSHQQLKQIFTQLKDYLGSVENKRTPIPVNSVDDIISITSSQPNEAEIPIVMLSSVTGEGVDLLHKLLFLLPPSLSPKERHRLEQEPAEFQIDETFKIPTVGKSTHSHNFVLGGLLTQGIVAEGEKLLLGPMYDGKFKPVTVTSIRRHKIPVLAVKASQSASIALDMQNCEGFRKGLVLIHPSIVPVACFYFQADICVLYHRTTISKGFQTTVHIGNVKQTAVVSEILSVSHLSTNDRASVVFKFIKRPEYIKIGSRLLFREGNTKGFGTVTQVL